MAAKGNPDLNTTLHWIRQAQARELGGLEQLQRQIYPRIRKVLKLACTQPGMPSPSDKVCEEAFVAAVRAFDRFELSTLADLFHWFFMTMQRDLGYPSPHFSADNERPGVPPMFETDADHTLGLLSPDSGDGPGQAVSTADAGSPIEECIAGLPQTYRDVILLRNYVGLSWERVAETFGLPAIDAARMIHAKAMVELHRRMRRKKA